MIRPLDENDVAALIAGLDEPPVAPSFLDAALARRLERPAAALRYAAFDLPIGRLFVAFDEAVLLSQVGGGSIAFETGLRHLGWDAQASDAPRALQAAVADLAEGATRFGYPVDTRRLATFQQRVLAAIRDIPRGEIRSYRWVARTIGTPTAVRAVGSALARNPIPVLLPCHRVVRSDHRLGEYSGGGTAVKARILRWEGVKVEARGDALAVSA